MATYTKPTQVPNWADDNVNNTEPSAAKKNLGWVFGEEPSSAFENWQMQLNGSWWKWINERFGDEDTSNRVTLIAPNTGQVMAKFSDFEFKWLSNNGASPGLVEVEAKPGQFIIGRGDTDGISLFGVGNQKLIIFDDLIATNGLIYNVTTDILGIHNGNATSTVDFGPTSTTFKQDVVVSANKHVTVSGTGHYKHGSRVAIRNGGSWITDTPGVDAGGHKYTETTPGDQLFLPIDLNVGERITNIQVYAKQATAGTIAVSLHTVSDTGTVSGAIASDNDTATATFVSLTLSLLTETVAANGSYHLNLSTTGTGRLTGGNVEVTFDRV